MAKNYNIQTFSDYLASSSSAAYGVIGGQVAAGMTRYVTFLRVEPVAPLNDEGSKVYICSTPLVSGVITAASATLAQKMVILIPSASTTGYKGVAVPASPSTEHPLFTVAGGSYLRALLAPGVATMSSTVQVFVQYFDE